jgi:uncharacterized protein YndB with AHSA1/START domain
MAEKWTVKGRIVVDHLLPELQTMHGARSGVDGIIVKVSARSKIPLGWGTWNPWEQVTTGADGGFRVTTEKGSDRRQFKVQILFDSSKLRIKEGKETSFKLGSDGFPIDIDIDLTDKDWHEVHSDKDDDAERRAGVHDLGDIKVTGSVLRKHADLWILYNKAIALMASYGAEYIFKGKVVVKYPMSLSGSNWSSYWNPLNGHGYIKQDQFDAYTLLHELVHKWEYDHSTGENGMAWQLVKHQSTHQSRENTTFVPFLESFADWAAVKMLQAISDGKVTNFLQAARSSRPDHPFSREHIGGNLSEQERSLANLDYTERGWYGLFNVLTFPWLDRIDVDRFFTDTQGEDRRFAFLSLFSPISDLRLGYTFKDVLSVFLTAPAKGIDNVLSTREMNFRDFLDRAGAILPGFDADKIKGVKSLLNPRPRVSRAVVASV